MPMENIEIIQMKRCSFRTFDDLIIIFLMVIKYNYGEIEASAPTPQVDNNIRHINR